MTPTIKIKRLHPQAKLPTYATDGASGLDLYASESCSFGSLPCLVPTGIAVEIPIGYEAQIRPRSSLSMRGIHASLGTIDSDYRGEVKVCMWTDSDYHKCDVLQGDRIAQLVIAPVARAAVVEVDELAETARGSGGFGSTGR